VQNTYRKRETSVHSFNWKSWWEKRPTQIWSQNIELIIAVIAEALICGTCVGVISMVRVVSPCDSRVV
jgi:hypothetical protein